MKLRFLVSVGALVCVPSGWASGQSLTDQKTAAEIAKIQVDTEKAKVDMQKARIEADNALFGALRQTSGGQATVTAGEKTAEALLLTKASLAGASGRLIALFSEAGIPPSPSVQPIVVWGSMPPSVSQWLLFQQERDKVGTQLKKAMGKWSAAHGTKMAFLPAATAVATLVATAIPLFKTDTTVTGGAVATDEADVRASVAAALAVRGYGSELGALEVANGVTTAKQLLQPLDDDFEAVRAAYEDTYLALIKPTLRPKSPASARIVAAAAEMEAALNAHRALKTSLLTESGGAMASTIVDRQRRLHESPAAVPIIYVLNADAAFSATTKKGLLTGLGGRVPAYATATTLLDYAFVAPGVRTRGTVGCTIGKRPIKDLLALNPTTFKVEGEKLCDSAASR